MPLAQSPELTRPLDQAYRGRSGHIAALTHQQDILREKALPLTFTKDRQQAFAQALRNIEARAKEASLAQHDGQKMALLQLGLWLMEGLGWVLVFSSFSVLSIFLIAIARHIRFTVVAHHVLHGCLGQPKAKSFARGLKRWWQWPDLLPPARWQKEHNILHHYYLGESQDPDLVEDNLAFLRCSSRFYASKVLFVLSQAFVWKWTYYTPTLIKVTEAAADKQKFPESRWLLGDQSFDIRGPRGRIAWLSCYLPYGFLGCFFIPIIGGLITGSLSVALIAMAHIIAAELISNALSFVAIVPNHAGSEVHRFTDRPKTKEEFFIRQVLGSANVKSPHGLGDLLLGYLNFQIEHHLFPDLSPFQLRRISPEIQALCQEYGLPYISHSLWQSSLELVAIATGKSSMKVTHSIA